MTEAEKTKLRAAYAIMDAFREMLAGDVLEKTGTLYMDRDFQGLESACGLVGEILKEPGMLRRLIENEDTRQSLRTGYLDASLAGQNAAEGSSLQTACLNLESVFYCVLNTVWDGSHEAGQNAIARANTAASYGLEILDGLEKAGPGTLSAMTLAKDGQQMDVDRIARMRRALSMLQPGRNENRQEGGADDVQEDM